MGKSRRIQNLSGAAKSYLANAKKYDFSSSFKKESVRLAPSKYQDLVLNILKTVHAIVIESDVHQLDVASRTTDVILGRIATLLDEVKENFVDNELDDIKEEIIDAIESPSLFSSIRNALIKQLIISKVIDGIRDLFDNSASKDDVNDVKSKLSEILEKISFSENNTQQPVS